MGLVALSRYPKVEWWFTLFFQLLSTRRLCGCTLATGAHTSYAANNRCNCYTGLSHTHLSYNLTLDFCND